MEKVLDDLITYQKAKVLKLAQRLVPGATPEDIRNPQDLQLLKTDPDFNFEDGILAGLLSAQMALRAESNPVSSH